MNWTLIQSFLAIYETGSLSGAGRRLGASQPTMGRHLSELEAELGLTLFQRSHRHLEPTQAARDLARDAGIMRDAADRLSRSASGQAPAIAGPVRITCSEVVAHYHLPAITAEITAIHPELELEIVASNDTQNLLRREADIAIRMRRPEQADLVARAVGRLPIGFFAHERYLARYGTPEALATLLRDHVIIGYDRDDLMIRGFAAGGIKVSPRAFRLRSDNQPLHVELMRQGAGIAAVQTAIAAALPGVLRVLPSVAIPPLEVFLATHRDLRHAPRIVAVLDALETGLARVCDLPGS